MKKRTLATLLLSLLIISIGNPSRCEKPKINANGAILMDIQSRRILLDYNSNTRLPMASTTKIMTALVALDNKNISDNVVINNSCVGIEGSSIYLEEGEKISLDDLLYGLMLRSGNDSAIALADHICGNLNDFVYLMNKKAHEIGAQNTNFKNPHGLHDEDHFSTAYDLALITTEAMKSEKFREIIGTGKWIADRKKNNIFYNKNKTLWEYEGGDGVKIGYTKRAGRCLVASATRDDIGLIAVVLNDYDWFNDCYKLMDYGFENYRPYVLYDKGQFFKNIPVANGNKKFVPAISNNSFIYSLKEDELNEIKMFIDIPKSLEAPIAENDRIGYITVYLNGKIIHKGEIISKENVDNIGFIEKIMRSIRDRRHEGD